MPPKKLLQLLLVSFFSGVLASACISTPEAGPDAEYVIILGFDALSPDGILNSNTPNLDEMATLGASSLAARAVLPTVSGPNWGSMLMGAGPAQHGITGNNWRPDDYILPPTDVGPGGIFPSIYSVLKLQRPELQTAIVFDWPTINYYFEHDFADHIYESDHPRSTTEERVGRAEDVIQETVNLIEQRAANFLFVHIDHVDHFGHRFGHGSDEFYQATAHADSLIGLVRQAITRADIADKTVLVVSSDHGGVGYGHGGSTKEEVLIPLYFEGYGVIPGADAGPYVRIYDIPATAAWLLGTHPPESWNGRAVTGVFEF